MAIRVLATYEFTVVGDGQTKKVDIPLAAMQSPVPFVDGQLPAEIGVVRVDDVVGLCTATWSGGKLTLDFDDPPNPTGNVVEVDALFGEKQ